MSNPLLPLATIWLHPRATMRALIDSPPTWAPFILIAIHGSLRALDRAAGRNAGDILSPSAIFALVLVAGLIAIPMWYIYAFFVRLTTRLLRGEAEPENIRLALAYGFTPALVGSLLTLIPVALGGHEFFKKEGDLPLWFLWLLIPIFIIQFILAIWATITTSKCVAEASGFSAWRGWFSLIIPFLAFIILLLAIIIPIALLTR